MAIVLTGGVGWGYRYGSLHSSYCQYQMEVGGVLHVPLTLPQAKEPLLPSELWNLHVTCTSHNTAAISLEMELVLVVSSC
jgi:hypothetical protein